MKLHLIHPVLVHFSVAFLVVGGVVEAVGILRRLPVWQRMGSAASLLGVGFLVATVASGFLAANSVPLPAGAHADLEDHERAGLILLAGWLLLVLWKAWHRGKLPETQSKMFAWIVMIAVVFTFWVAYLGGHLVYHLGVGVNV